MATIPLPAGLRFPLSFGLALIAGAAPILVADLWRGPPATAALTGTTAVLEANAIEARQPGDAPGQHRPAPFGRAVESEDGGRLTLELAMRRMDRTDAPGPTVLLAGAVHIADRVFYDRVQAILNNCDLVLFEGVRPPGAGVLTGGSDAEHVESTRRRLRFLAMAVERFRLEHGRLPHSLDEVAAQPQMRIVAGTREDAWGRAVAYVASPVLMPDGEPDPAAPSQVFDLVSLGADGVDGGEGPSADLRFADQPPLSPVERGEGANQGLQARLASALGLVFQKDAMDTTPPHWRNSDLSVDDLMARLEAAGAEGDTLFRLLDGSSLSAKFMGVLVRFIGASPTMRAMAKVTLIEMLSNADELLEAAPGMGGLMSVILHDRNAAVMDDLESVLREQPDLDTIAIFYGAGHLPDLQRRLAALGFQPSGDEWVPAIGVTLADAGLSPAQAKSMREMMRRSIEQQVNRARPKGESR